MSFSDWLGDGPVANQIREVERALPVYSYEATLWRREIIDINDTSHGQWEARFDRRGEMNDAMIRQRLEALLAAVDMYAYEMGADLDHRGALERWHRAVTPPPPRERGPRQIPMAVRREVYERDGYACVRCGATENLNLDHIHPVAAGGTGDKDNLQVLCSACNRRKGARVGG